MKDFDSLLIVLARRYGHTNLSSELLNKQETFFRRRAVRNFYSSR